MPAVKSAEVFRPTLGSVLLAVSIAGLAFFFPQGIPLEWYPLPGSSAGLRYLEITCAANTTSSVQIFLNTGDGIREEEKISWPVAPGAEAFTYTFPLPDAPLRELRLDALTSPGQLRITNFRLTDRRGEELRRFTKDSFSSLHGISDINPIPEGWNMIVTGERGGWAHVDFSHFTFPEGMNERNLRRCVLSTGYLALMLWILLLALYFAFRHQDSLRHALPSVAFLLLLALLFSAVGNRGLIRNSLHRALVPHPLIPPGFQLEIDAVAPGAALAQLFWDTGHGFNEAQSVQRTYENHGGLQTLRLPLPLQPVTGFRFDPLDRDGRLQIRSIRLVDAGGATQAVLPLECLQPAKEIARFKTGPGELTIEIEPGNHDPILLLRAAEVARINRIETSVGQPHF